MNSLSFFTALLLTIAFEICIHKAVAPPPTYEEMRSFIDNSPPPRSFSQLSSPYQSSPTLRMLSFRNGYPNDPFLSPPRTNNFDSFDSDPFPSLTLHRVLPIDKSPSLIYDKTSSPYNDADDYWSPPSKGWKESSESSSDSSSDFGKGGKSKNHKHKNKQLSQTISRVYTFSSTHPVNTPNIPDYNLNPAPVSGPPSPPLPPIGYPPVLTGAAVAATGGALGYALGSKPQLQPPHSDTPAVAYPAPNIPTDSNGQRLPQKEKCNWCIRQNCNPGGCQEVRDFNAKADAEKLRDALKKKQEKAVIEILTHRSESQIKRIMEEYQSFERDLRTDIDKEDFESEKLLEALIMPRAEYFARELHKACEKQDSESLIMILTSLSPCAVKKVGVAYNRDNKHGPLAQAIKDATNLNFENFLVQLVKGDRPADGPVDSAQVDKDVKALKDAGPKKWFISDKSVFIDIFTHRSYAHLRQVMQKYGNNLEKDIKANTSGKLQSGLLTMMKNVLNQPGYFADELEGSLDKVFSSEVEDQDTLIRIMRGRCGIDLGDIRDAYPDNHDKKILADRLKSKKTKYSEVLQAMLRDPGSQTWKRYQ